MSHPIRTLWRKICRREDPLQMTRDRFGGWAENQAAFFLRKTGCKILARNYRTTFGELDLIARDRKCLVFVEVKAVRDVQSAPELKVDRRKRRKMITTAKAFIARFNLYDLSARFDIITVKCDENGQSDIQHVENAFEAT